jgi:hypothetical protein
VVLNFGHWSVDLDDIFANFAFLVGFCMLFALWCVS